MTLTELRARLEAIFEELRAIDTEAGDTALTDEQTTAFDTLVTERSEVEARIAAEERRAEQRDALARVPEQRRETGDGTRGVGAPARDARARVTEPLTYNAHSRNSYFLDLARAQVLGDGDARARLQRHSQEMDVEMPMRERRREDRARRQMESIPDLEARHVEGAFEQRVNPNRTDGTGGYFVRVAA